MGVLLKVILFGLVIYYVFKTVGSFVLRIFGGQPQQPSTRQTAQQRRRGEINIDHMPKGKNQKGKTGSKDGDYIDYEEVK